MFLHSWLDLQGGVCVCVVSGYWNACYIATLLTHISVVRQDPPSNPPIRAKEAVRTRTALDPIDTLETTVPSATAHVSACSTARYCSKHQAQLPAAALGESDTQTQVHCILAILNGMWRPDMQQQRLHV
jgi:hypothetical protein